MTPSQGPRWRQWWQAVPIDRADVLVVLGLGLVAVGCWEWFRPGAFLVPGAVIVWYALPSRPPFIAPRDPKGRR